MPEWADGASRWHSDLARSCGRGAHPKGVVWPRWVAGTRWLLSEPVMGAASVTCRLPSTHFSLRERLPFTSVCRLHPRHTGRSSTQPCPNYQSQLPVTPAVHCPRDLTDNRLTTLPLAGLAGLMQLKLRGNPALSQAFSKDSFPKLR